jgi:predicted transcriptional regulator
MKKSELKQIIKEEIENHFLKSPLTQQLNKLVFNLFDSDKITEEEYKNIQNILKRIDKKI